MSFEDKQHVCADCQVIAAKAERARIIQILRELQESCFSAKNRIGVHNGWTLENAIIFINRDIK